MTWTLHIHAMDGPRLLSRILQVLENQMVSIRSFAGEGSEGQVCMTWVVSSEKDKAYRIEALLGRLHDVLGVWVQLVREDSAAEGRRAAAERSKPCRLST